MLIGRFCVVWFHVFDLLFVLAISFAAYALAARFTAQPLWGALLVAASPIVQVNTNTLAGPEAPGLALLLVGAAAFFWRPVWAGGLPLARGRPAASQAPSSTAIRPPEHARGRPRPPS